MNKKDVSDKIKKDLVNIENKLLNHDAFKFREILKDSEAEDIKVLTRTYQDILCYLVFEKEDINYCKERQNAINTIYENIKVRSEYYLENNYNHYYKKIIDAFSNTIRIYDYYDTILKRLNNK